MEAFPLVVECETRIKMSFDDSSIAKLVLKALQPDNEPLPSGMELSSRMSDGEVVFEIRSRRPIMSLLATLDDIIASAILVLKAAQALDRP